VEKSGIPVAAVVPLSVLEDAEDKELKRQEAIEALRQAQSGFADVSDDEAEREIAKALDEIRQERRLAKRIVSALVRSEPDLFTSSEEFLVSEVGRYLRDEEARALAARRDGRE
jgi:hypothetical protein